MAAIRWLHLSDLHAGMPEASTLWRAVRGEFWADLERLHEAVGGIDVVLFTGDIAYSGKAPEYGAANEWLGELFTKLAKLGSSPALLAVPGNHDVRWPEDLTAYEWGRLFNWKSDAGMRATFWDALSGEVPRALVNGLFTEYLRWWEPWRARASASEGVRIGSARLMAGDFSASIEKGGLSLGIVGLNSSFLQFRSRVAPGDLAIHPSQLRAVTGNDLEGWAGRHSTCFLLTHHPPAWLAPDARDAYERSIVVHPRFAAHFCGHLHDPMDMAEILGGGAEHRIVLGTSAFGRERTTDRRGQNVQRRHGYSVGSLTRNGDHGATLRVFPRALRYLAGRWQLVPDPVHPHVDGGASSVEIPIRTPPDPGEAAELPPVGDAKPPSQRVTPPASARSDERVYSDTFGVRPLPVAAANRAEESRPPPVRESEPTPPPVRESEPTPPPVRESEPTPPPVREPTPPPKQQIQAPGALYDPSWYVPWDAQEQQVLESLRRAGALVALTGAPLSGKTTVLHRLMDRLRREDTGRKCIAIPIDLGALPYQVELDYDVDPCLREIAKLLVQGFCQALPLDAASATTGTKGWVDLAWRNPMSPERRLASILEERILPLGYERVVLVFDGVERIIGRPAGTPVARRLLLWAHNPASPVRVLLGATNLGLFFSTSDAVSTLFGATQHVRLENFGLPELEHLARLYGGGWHTDELRRLLDLVDGQPYLSRQIMFLAASGTPKPQLLDLESLKLDHCASILHQMWLRYQRRRDVHGAFLTLLTHPEEKLPPDAYHLLEQVGLVRSVGEGFVPANVLLASYFRDRT